MRFLLVLLLALPAGAEVLFQRGDVRVRQLEGHRILETLDKKQWTEQSRCSVVRPYELVYPYSRLQAAAVLYPQHLRRICVVGLGGASLTKALARGYPECEIVSVEIDPVVAEAARRFFYYLEGPRVRTVIADAREFLEKTSSLYDLVYLDAYAGLDIPPPLRTVEFYRTVKRCLTPGGAVVSNLHVDSKLYERDLATLGSVFPHLAAFRGMDQNLVMGSLQPPARRQRDWPFSFSAAEPVRMHIPSLPVLRD